MVARSQRFQGAINKAKVSCVNGGESVQNHFPQDEKVVTRSQGGGSVQEDYKLSRYACYLIAQNGDPRKEQIASAQKYFAIKTREAEVVIPKALEEIEVLKLRVELVTVEQQLLDTRHYLTTALPKVVGDRTLGVTEVKDIEYRDRIISGNEIINAGDTINKTELCRRYGVLTKDYKMQILHLVETGRGKVHETWVHPEIAIDFAEWLSPEFSSFVKRIFIRYLKGDRARKDKIYSRSNFPIGS